MLSDHMHVHNLVLYISLMRSFSKVRLVVLSSSCDNVGSCPLFVNADGKLGQVGKLLTEVLKWYM